MTKSKDNIHRRENKRSQMFCKTESSHHYFACNADKSGSYFTTVRQAKASNGRVDSKTHIR